MKDLLIYANMGLGDAIILNGALRKLAETRCVFFLCQPHNFNSIVWMFMDHAQISVKAVVSDEGAEAFIREQADNPRLEVLRLGCTGVGWTTGQGFDQTMYRQAGVPFEQRWDGFHVERAPDEVLPPSQQFAFIHDDRSREFIIRNLPADILGVVRPDSHKTPNIFQWRRVLEEASEIHCIPSSFAHLADSLALREGVKLFLHGSARPGWDRHTSRHNWTIL